MRRSSKVHYFDKIVFLDLRLSLRAALFRLVIYNEHVFTIGQLVVSNFLLRAFYGDCKLNLAFFTASHFS